MVSTDHAAFGAQLAKRREAAQMSQAELARRAGVTRGTIRNLERGNTTPAPETVSRLQRVLPPFPSASDPPPSKPATQLAPTYDPLRMADDMASALSGAGGQLDQAWLYLDPQSARDWLRYCGEVSYVSNYRDRIPVADIASQIATRVRAVGADVVALGSGDARTEIALVSHLLTELHQPVHLDLLDVSHTLLIAGYRAAVNTLGGAGTHVGLIFGDFYQIARDEVLTVRAPHSSRRRIWTLIGHTVGNLRDELMFFRDLASISRPGDLVAVDFQIVRADASDPDAIRAKDPGLSGQLPESLKTWITGPLRRFRPAESLELKPWLNTRCRIPDSYEIIISADVMRDKQRVEYHLARFKRFEPRQLSDALAEVGWRELAQFRYGPEPRMCGVLLAERAE